MTAAGPSLRRTVIERNIGMVYINQHDYPHLLYSGEVLIRDCDNRDPGFFCFWRK